MEKLSIPSIAIHLPGCPEFLQTTKFVVDNRAMYIIFMILNQCLIMLSTVRFATEVITVGVKMTFAIISRITLVNFHFESM
jgi:hypothetical protein